MKSRMEKYYTEENNIEKRSKRNESLYTDIKYKNYDEYENLPIPDNSNIIDLSRIKKNHDSRDEYRKVRDVNKFTDLEEPVEYKNIISKQEETIYDINELISRARKEKEKLQKVQEKIIKTNYNFLSTLESSAIDDIKPKEETTTASDILEKTRVNKTDNTSSSRLSLDILSDLKPSGDTTIISKQIIDETATIKKQGNLSSLNNTQVLPKKEEKDDFYSSSYTFTKKDFDDDFEEEKKTHIPTILKVILIILFIGILFGITYFILTYFDIKIIS